MHYIQFTAINAYRNFINVDINGLNSLYLIIMYKIIWYFKNIYNNTVK